MTSRIPTLYLHIGAGKCGSSAIQQFLAINQTALREQGVLLPGRGLDPDRAGADQHLVFFEQGVGNKDFAPKVKSRLDRLAESAHRHGLSKVVISAENLINPNRFWRLFIEAGDLFDIKVVAYVRRQDDFMISAWQQWQLKQQDSFQQYYEDNRSQIDWHRQLEPWRRVFGSVNMIVRRYSGEHLVDGDVVQDFGHVLGIDVAGLARPGLTNRSLDERFNDMANRHRDRLFQSANDNRFYKFLAELLGEEAFKNYRGSSLLTLAQRQQIMADHADANERLRRDYFPEIPVGEHVFLPPSESDIHTSPEPPPNEETELRYVELFEEWAGQRESPRQVTQNC